MFDDVRYRHPSQFWLMRPALGRALYRRERGKGRPPRGAATAELLLQHQDQPL